MAKIKNTLNTLNEIEEKIEPIEETKEDLQKKIEEILSIDGMVGLFYANNKKFNEIAKSLNSFVLDVAEGGKVFTNYLALQKELKSMFETQQWLKRELKLTDEDIENETKKYIPPIELRVLSK